MTLNEQPPLRSHLELKIGQPDEDGLLSHYAPSRLLLDLRCRRGDEAAYLLELLRVLSTAAIEPPKVNVSLTPSSPPVVSEPTAEPRHLTNAYYALLIRVDQAQQHLREMTTRLNATRGPALDVTAVINDLLYLEQFLSGSDDVKLPTRDQGGTHGSLG